MRAEDRWYGRLLLAVVIGIELSIVAIYQLYLNQWPQIRWRCWLTRHGPIMKKAAAPVAEPPP